VHKRFPQQQQAAAIRWLSENLPLRNKAADQDGRSSGIGSCADYTFSGLELYSISTRSSYCSS
jgi:hypothetical protein